MFGINAYYKLQWKNFLNKQGFWILLVFSPVLLLILGSAFSIAIYLPQLTIFNSLIISLIYFGGAVRDIENSTIHKSILSAGFLKRNLIISSILFISTIIFISTINLFFWAFIFDFVILADTLNISLVQTLIIALDTVFSNSPIAIFFANPNAIASNILMYLGVYPISNNIPWNELSFFTIIYIVTISSILSCLIAYFFATKLETDTSYFTFVLIYILIGIVAGSFIIPPNLVDNNVFLSIISYSYPHYYVSNAFINMMQIPFSNSNVIVEGNQVVVEYPNVWDFSQIQNVLNFIMPILFIILFLFLNLFTNKKTTFKKEERNENPIKVTV